MSLKSAAFLALVGMILATVVLLSAFLTDLTAAARGLIPAMRLFPSFIYAFASFCLTVFFYVFYRRQ